MNEDREAPASTIFDRLQRLFLGRHVFVGITASGVRTVGYLFTHDGEKRIAQWQGATYSEAFAEACLSVHNAAIDCGATPSAMVKALLAEASRAFKEGREL